MMAQKHLEALIARSPVGIFETDAAGQCTFVNERWSELTGLSAAESLGDGWFLAIHPDDRARINDERTHAASEGRPFTLEYRVRRPDGSILCELVTNVFKYAYPEGRAGEASVSLTLEGARVTLCVDDDGVGLPPGVDIENAKTFGWKLVRSLVSQIEGEMTQGCPSGVHVCISFGAPAFGPSALVTM